MGHSRCVRFFHVWVTPERKTSLAMLHVPIGTSDRTIIRSKVPRPIASQPLDSNVGESAWFLPLHVIIKTSKPRNYTLRLGSSTGAAKLGIQSREQDRTYKSATSVTHTCPRLSMSTDHVQSRTRKARTRRGTNQHAE